MTSFNSELPGFYRLSIESRRERIAELTDVSKEDLVILSGDLGLQGEQANTMVENAVGVMGVPLGVCVNLRVNGRDRLLPMAVEEPSVIAAASHAAKLLRSGDGILAEVTEPIMIGQVQLLDVPDREEAERNILAARAELLELANHSHDTLRSVGGGARDMEVRHLAPLAEDDPEGWMLVVHLLVDVRDAMGANAVNSMCERLSSRLEELSGGRVGLRILSNLSDRRLVSIRGRVPFSALEGKGGDSPEDLANAIQSASIFAERDPYRAATHNKGIMNGVDAVLLAFGQDWRAVEAGAHAFAHREGRYTAMARWRARDGYLEGRMEIPMAVGTVGGVARVHPTVAVSKRIARVESAADLASLTAAVGLCQNLGALRALAAEGIQQGHMRLHARNVAVEAGAVGAEVELVADTIAAEGRVNVSAAREALERARAA